MFKLLCMSIHVSLHLKKRYASWSEMNQDFWVCVCVCVCVCKFGGKNYGSLKFLNILLFFYSSIYGFWFGSDLTDSL